MDHNLEVVAYKLGLAFVHLVADKQAFQLILVVFVLKLEVQGTHKVGQKQAGLHLP